LLIILKSQNANIAQSNAEVKAWRVIILVLFSPVVVAVKHLKNGRIDNRDIVRAPVEVKQLH
jgi:hypothetical protein